MNSFNGYGAILVNKSLKINGSFLSNNENLNEMIGEILARKLNNPHKYSDIGIMYLSNSKSNIIRAVANFNNRGKSIC